MQKACAAGAARRPGPLWVVVLSAGLIVGIAMGLRQVMGLYLTPMTKELGIGREPFSHGDGDRQSGLGHGRGVRRHGRRPLRRRPRRGRRRAVDHGRHST